MTTRTNPQPDSVPAQNTSHNTSDYSATKAPENRPHVESTVPTDDHRARPGGAHGASGKIGMEGLDAETAPTELADLHQRQERT
jgi:hypothetical protein